MRIKPEPCFFGLHIENADSCHLQAFRRIRQCIVILLSSLILSLGGCGEKQAPPATPPPEVEVAQVVQQDVPLYTECISTLDGYVNAQIQPQVTGYLMKQNYAEGTVVHKGSLTGGWRRWTGERTSRRPGRTYHHSYHRLTGGAYQSLLCR